MKRFEIVFGILILIALFFKIAHWHGGGILATISLTSLACFYYLFSFAFFNKIRLTNIFKGSSYKGISTQQIIVSIVAGFGLSTVCIGILFKMMHWHGAAIMLLSGLITIFVVAIISLIKFFRSKNDCDKQILLRIAIIGVIGLFSFFSTDLGLV